VSVIEGNKNTFQPVQYNLSKVIVASKLRSVLNQSIVLNQFYKEDSKLGPAIVKWGMLNVKNLRHMSVIYRCSTL
jgi:hypothetical protein